MATDGMVREAALEIECWLISVQQNFPMPGVRKHTGIEKV